MTTDTFLLGLATATPQPLYAQDQVADMAKDIFASRMPAYERLATVFDNAGIDTRSIAAPAQWYVGQPRWPQRSDMFRTVALDLLEDAALRALASAGLQPEAVDAIVVVSTTGISTPSLDAYLINRLPFRPDVRRLPVFGYGCAGGVLGLSRAVELCRATPDSIALLLVVELCTLAFRDDDPSPASIVATALFSDGAAAAVLCSPAGVADTGSLPRLGASFEWLWPDTLDIMGWRIDDPGFGIILSRNLPKFVREAIVPPIDTFLARQGISRSDLSGYICHPGGEKIMTALEDALDLPSSSAHQARGVLRNFGNMSAATVLFVLERHLSRPDKGLHLMIAMGPGFTLALQLIEI